MWHDCREFYLTRSGSVRYDNLVVWLIWFRCNAIMIGEHFKHVYYKSFFAFIGNGFKDCDGEHIFRLLQVNEYLNNSSNNINMHTHTHTHTHVRTQHSVINVFDILTFNCIGAIYPFCCKCVCLCMYVCVCVCVYSYCIQSSA